MAKIYDVARAFDVAWETQLRVETEGKLKDAIESIMANRHNIAARAPQVSVIPSSRTIMKDRKKCWT